jgi:adenylate cyclase
MEPDPSAQKSIVVSISSRVIKARHELHNSLGHILGFSEVMLEEVQAQGRDDVCSNLEFIRRTAGKIVAQIDEGLDAPKIEAGFSDLSSLERQVCEQAAQIAATADTLVRNATALPGGGPESDLLRIAGAARHTVELARTLLPGLSEAATAGTLLKPAVGPLAHRLPVGSDTSQTVQARKEGSILVVDDLEQNRELLSRRLTRLGYKVAVVDSGQRALDDVAAHPVDLILLDILMPGLDGLEVLQRLKTSPHTEHIPVIMLSSADEIDTVVRCITLGADDFLPKPFNATLLMARIESSLSKKRLRDQEAAFLKRLQAEQETSERLLLNILPKPIADRLRQGEKVIADSFAEVTVLFSDFVDFSKASVGIPPRELVGRLNEVFSAFDRLCEHYGLEKIKMIGDGYMAVGGVPTPCANHAQAAADLALAMQQEVPRFAGAQGQPFQMRIGLSTGPVVAGVIGTRKFAYDLWGDTVNMAKRMETHAPPGGILVMPPTYERLRGTYSFAPGRAIQIKGTGDVLTYQLLGPSPSAAGREPCA